MTRFDDGAAVTADGQPVLAPECTPWHFYPMRRAGYQNCRNAADDLLGPYPERTVETFRNLGLNDDEIAQYFGTSLHRIKHLLDRSKRSHLSGTLRHVAKLMRAKLFEGTIR